MTFNLKYYTFELLKTTQNLTMNLYLTKKYNIIKYLPKPSTNFLKRIIETVQIFVFFLSSHLF